jgi:hypothetical protein
VSLSLLLHLLAHLAPHVAEVGLVPGTEHFRNIHRHEVRVTARGADPAGRRKPVLRQRALEDRSTTGGRGGPR